MRNSFASDVFTLRIVFLPKALPGFCSSFIKQKYGLPRSLFGIFDTSMFMPPLYCSHRREKLQPLHYSLGIFSSNDRKFLSLHIPTDSFCRNGRDFFYLSHHSEQKFQKQPVFSFSVLLVRNYCIFLFEGKIFSPLISQLQLYGF